MLLGGQEGAGGGAGWSSDTPWYFMLLQSRQSPTVQAFWLVLRTSPIHGALPSSPGRGRGWSCYIHLLLLHTSPMKVSSYLAGPWLVLTTSLVHGGRLPSNPERRGGGGSWSCNHHSMVFYATALLCRPFGLF